MNRPCIHVEYQVWYWRSNNVIACFDTAGEALQALNSWVDREGETILSDLYLSSCKWSPDLSDEARQELDDDDRVGPETIMLDVLASMQMAEPPRIRTPDSKGNPTDVRSPLDVLPRK